MFSLISKSRLSEVKWRTIGTGIGHLSLALPLVVAGSLAQAAPRLDVPYVATPPDVVQRMLEMAEVQPHDHLIDLGSGDGRIVIAAARDWGVRNARGIDLDPERVEEARENARREGVEGQVEFEQGDLFDKDLSDATVVTMYLLSAVNARLRPVILETMAPGTRIVSHAFDMGPWEPDAFDTLGGSSIYMWTVPAQVGGLWQLTTPDGEELTMMLQQRFQQLHASADLEGNPGALIDASIHGAEIRFSIGRDDYIGQVEGDRIVPVASSEGLQDWHARRL
ncbi:MAG: SAM-dependent methyltransferase [Pseudomonas sp.]